MYYDLFSRPTPSWEWLSRTTCRGPRPGLGLPFGPGRETAVAGGAVGDELTDDHGVSDTAGPLGE